MCFMKGVYEDRCKMVLGWERGSVYYSTYDLHKTYFVPNSGKEMSCSRYLTSCIYYLFCRWLDCGSPELRVDEGGQLPCCKNVIYDCFIDILPDNLTGEIHLYWLSSLCLDIYFGFTFSHINSCFSGGWYNSFITTACRQKGSLFFCPFT